MSDNFFDSLATVTLVDFQRDESKTRDQGHGLHVHEDEDSYLIPNQSLSFSDRSQLFKCFTNISDSDQFCERKTSYIRDVSGSGDQYNPKAGDGGRRTRVFFIIKSQKVGSIWMKEYCYGKTQHFKSYIKVCLSES